MKYDIVTIGGALEDITFCIREGQVIDNRNDILRQRLLAFEYGAKIRVKDKDASFTFGGGASNVAVAASRLGLKTACIIAIGEGTRAKRILNNLKKQKVDTSLCQMTKEGKSGFSFSLMLYPEYEHTIFSYRGVNNELYLTQKFLNEIDSENLYICSLDGRWKDLLKNIFSQSSRHKIFWNPGSTQLAEPSSIRRYLPKTYAIILNEDEATELVVSDKKIMNDRRDTASFLNNTKNLLRIIKDYGPRIVVITRGKKGADAYDGENFYHVNIKRSKRIDTTGIGDAFGASFACGLKIYKGDIKKAMDLGIRNTASVVSHTGAQNGLIKL